MPTAQINNENHHIYSAVGTMANILIAILKNLQNLDNLSKKQIKDWASSEIEILEAIKEADERNIKYR